MIRSFRSDPRASTIARAAWGIGDQALSSLTNFGLSIAVARHVGTEEFGAFSIAFAVYLVALTVMRALAADPLVIRYSGKPTEAWRVAIRASTGTALLAGIVSGGLVVVAGLLVGGSLGEALVIMGFGLPALLVQDAWRFAFFAAGRGRSAFLNDLAWTIALVMALGVIIVTGERSIGAVVVAWVIGGLAGALVGIGQAHVVPDPRRAPAWWREQHDIAPRLAVEAAILSGAQPVTLSAVGIVAGLVTVGTIRAGQVLMNAIHILTFGIQLFGVPEAVRTLERSTASLIRLCAILGIGLMALSLVWGGALIALPTELGQALLGATWEPARTVLLPVAVLSAAAGLQAGALIGLRALAATRRSLVARIATSLALSIGAIVGAITGGAVGGAWGFAIGVSIGAAFWWRQFLQAAHGHQRQTDIQDDVPDQGSAIAATVAVVEDASSSYTV